MRDMDIMIVRSDLVATRRLEGLGGISLKVLTDERGGVEVACDPVGVPPGRWVIATRGTAARYAAGSSKALSDLTICGIIDNWETPALELVPDNKGEK
jgi:ethanolamine utilization protein EutN